MFLISLWSSSLTIFTFQPQDAVHLHPASEQERRSTIRHPGTRGRHRHDPENHGTRLDARSWPAKPLCAPVSTD